jgi:hypothetical protein
MLTAWHLRRTRTSQGSVHGASSVPARVAWCWLLHVKGKNVKMLAKSSSGAAAAFSLVKKPPNVEVLSSPHRKSREHHQSPQVSRVQTHLLAKRNGTEMAKADSQDCHPGCSQGVVPTAALLPNPERRELGMRGWSQRWGPCSPSCPEHEA